MQDLNGYRELLTQRTRLVEQMTEDERRLNDEAEQETAKHTQKMGELAIAAEREAAQSVLSIATQSGQQRLQAALEASDREYNAEVSALNKEIENLDKFSRDYENKQKALYDKLDELKREHDNRNLQLTNQAQSQELGVLTVAQAKMASVFADGFTQVIMGKESMGRMLEQVDSQIIAGMLKTALMSMATRDMTKEKDAAAAARDAFAWGWANGGPAAPILAPTLGAAAFAAEMAFSEGGIVPGVGNADTVATRLTPGETVLPKSLSEGLLSAARSGTLGGGTTVHVHVNHSPTIHALDAEGMGRVLEKNADVLTKHVTNQLRKMNR